jgi:hypothetical protein
MIYCIEEFTVKRIVFLIFAITILCGSNLYSVNMNYAVGIYAGFAPSFGNSLQSYVQEAYLGSSAGIDNMNTTLPGAKTTQINHLLGVSGGMEIKGIFLNYYFVRIGTNYTMGVYGGKGTTLYTEDNVNYYRMNCKYSLIIFDVPFTVGLSVPFWKDMKISMSCGIAYARAVYKNKFESSETPTPFIREGSFKGSAYPLVFMIEGEYFVRNNISLISIITYYNGSTKLLRDGQDTDTTGLDVDGVPGPDGVVDYSLVNFTGYRFYMGVSFYVRSI